MKIAVVFDDWKLHIFKRHLAQSDLQFSPLSGIPAGTLGFCVVADDQKLVEKIVRAANTEAATTKQGSPDAN